MSPQHPINSTWQGIDLYPAASFPRTHSIGELQSRFAKDPAFRGSFRRQTTLLDGRETPIQVGEQVVRLAGRIQTKPSHNTNSSHQIVFQLSNATTERITVEITPQLQPDPDSDSEQLRYTSLTFDQAAELNPGDYVGIVGLPQVIEQGSTVQFTIRASYVCLLSKATLPLESPSDVALARRYRERTLATHPPTFSRFQLRSRILQGIRFYLDESGFSEIETPILQDIKSGASAKAFTTHHPERDNREYVLRVAPELYLKRAVCGGFDRVFELGRVLRREGLDDTNAINPELTTLEIYQAYADYIDMLQLMENIISFSAVATGHPVTIPIQFGTTPINLERTYTDSTRLPGYHWRIVTLTDIVTTTFHQLSGLNIAVHLSAHPAEPVPPDLVTQVNSWCSGQGKDPLSAADHPNLGLYQQALFEACVKDHLGPDPLFIIDHPEAVSKFTLAKSHRHKPGYVESVELFINQVSIGTAFSELNDPAEQRNRFEGEEQRRRAGDEKAQSRDEDYLEALAFGMPPCGGLGLWVDRLVMLLTDTHDIRDSQLFPIV